MSDQEKSVTSNAEESPAMEQKEQQIDPEMKATIITQPDQKIEVDEAEKEKQKNQMEDVQIEEIDIELPNIEKDLAKEPNPDEGY